MAVLLEVDEVDERAEVVEVLEAECGEVVADLAAVLEVVVVIRW